MRSSKGLGSTLVLIVVGAGCATSGGDVGDGIDDDKSDSSEPSRALDLHGAPLTLDSSSVGYAVRGKLDPSTYPAVMFTARANAPVRALTRSWLTESGNFGWDTEPRLYKFAGPAGADPNDWSNWSQVSRGFLGQLGQTGSHTISADGTYLVILTAEEPAYAAQADFLIYLSHAGADLSQHPASVSGEIRCGAARTPAHGVQLSIDENTERVVSGSDGRFSFAQRYPLGRRNIWAQPTSSVDSTTVFDAVIAPDGGRVVLLLDRCP